MSCVEHVYNTVNVDNSVNTLLTATGSTAYARLTDSSGADSH